MKLSDATSTKKIKPFFEDEKVKITAQEKHNKITSFTLLWKPTNKEKVFKVKDFKIIEAWIQLEHYFDKISKNIPV